MSDEPSDDLKAFYARHSATGEPSTAMLARARARVLTAAARQPAAPAKRPWLRHEAMAVAAVLVVMVGAQGLYLLLRPPPTTEVAAVPQDDEVKAVVSAYQAGDVAGAQRLASKGGPACAPLTSKLKQVLGLSQRVGELSPAELAQLARLDQELAAGRQTALGLKVAQLTQQAPASPDQAPALYASATDALRARDLERAVSLAEQCLRADPAFYNCQKVLGSAWAKLANRDSSAIALANARAAYERFLALAPPDDESAPKVRMMLEDSRPAPEPPPARLTRAFADPEELFAQATTAKQAGQWAVVGIMALQILEIEPGHAGAQALVKEAHAMARQVYLRAYQLKESNPEEAFNLYGDVLAMTAPDDEFHVKAQARRDALAEQLKR